MTLTKLAWANLRASPLGSAINILLLALGTASIVLLLLIGDQLARTLSRDARGVDLVLGAHGSPVQLILSSVYHADVPTGNIPLAEAERWAKDPRITQAIPLSLGDSYRGHRIVGTTQAYPELYGGQLAQGRMWQAPMEAVAGAAAAREAGLAPGGAFTGAHGLTASGHAHAGHPYRVVGLLAPTGTVLDRLVLTSLESVWQLHDTHHDEDGGSHQSEPGHHDDEHHEEAHHAGEHHPEGEAEASPAEGPQITAMLLRYASPLAAMTLPREINLAGSLQAAAPAFELSRLLQLVGLGLDGLRAFAGLLILTAAFSIFAALYGALKARRYELAMMRCLGATRMELLWSLLLEGLMLTLAGALLGLALAHGAMALLSGWLEATRGVALDAWVWLPEETLLLPALLVLGLLSALLPAWQAYRSDVARTLAQS